MVNTAFFGSGNDSYGKIKIYIEIIIILIEEKRNNNQLPTTIMKRENIQNTSI